jgi:cytochrome bd-type quinol oxidase subunit 1
MLYSALLLIHSWVRWIVILTGLLAAGRGIAGRFGNRRWTRTDDNAGAWFTRALDLQVLLGLILYFPLSPLTGAALRDFSGAMKDVTLRFYAVEHAFGMILAVAVAHIGHARVRKATHDGRRHLTAAIFFTIALILIFLSIPWPNMPYGRPLLRW